MKFKEGDTVEVTEEGARNFGQQGLVTGVDLAPNKTTVWVTVEFDNRPIPLVYMESCLKWIKADADYVQEWLG